MANFSTLQPKASQVNARIARPRGKSFTRSLYRGIARLPVVEQNP
jgi:hypothetical protein